MAEAPYQILGTSIPALVGRHNYVRQILGELGKQSPSHISLVGPKYSGKSVFLKSIADRLIAANEPFSCVILWDLAHLTPNSDEQFISALAGHLATNISPSMRDYASMLAGATYREIREVLEALGEEGFRILMIWDGFDRPLRSGTFSRNLWDQLRELALQPSLRLITASRRPLRELIRNEQSVTSDFWEIFGFNIRLGAFEEQDIDAIFEGHEVSLAKGARTEFVNSTGLYPPVALALANQLIGKHSGIEVGNADVVREAEAVALETRELLASIWDDCDQPARELFFALLEDSSLPVAETSPAPRLSLVERGMATIAASQLYARCRLMESYVRSQEADSGTLSRQFGSSENFERNMRSVLQLRLGQIDQVDSRLASTIYECLKDLPDNPRQCMRQFRDSVLARAIDLLLERELGSRFEIPEAWINYWRGFSVTDRFMETRKAPFDLGPRMKFLGLVANPINGRPMAKHISPLAYEMCQALKQLADFGVHSEGEGYTSKSALATIALSIELAAVVAKDVHTKLRQDEVERV